MQPQLPLFIAIPAAQATAFEDAARTGSAVTATHPRGFAVTPTPLAFLQLQGCSRADMTLVRVRLGAAATLSSTFTYAREVFPVQVLSDPETTAALDAPTVLVDDATGTWARFEHGGIHSGAWPRPGPAVIRVEGGRVVRTEWWQDNRRHRDGDLPAVVDSGNHKYEWWLDGQRHRAGDAPAVVHGDGTALQFLDGTEADVEDRAPPGACLRAEWHVHGKLHREDAAKPSILVLDNGEVTDRRWFRHGVPVI